MVAKSPCVCGPNGICPDDCGPKRNVQRTAPKAPAACFQCGKLENECECVARPGVPRGVAEAVFRPNHYARLFPEPITVINAWSLGFNLGNAVKYIARAGHKGDRVEDLEKARRYIDIELEVMRRRVAVEAGADKRLLIEAL